MNQKKHCPCLYVVIPCYNEQEVLPATGPLFKEELNLLISKGKISDKSRILFVNDGSKDNTWNIICDWALKDKQILGISQSCNMGHQNAVLAGLMEVKDMCDISISIDCDGQDDICAMENMVNEYVKGFEIVYGVRKQRKTDTFFKRFTAESFYKLLKKMKVNVVYNHADYRLVSAKVLYHFADFKEVNLFLRGMFPLVGFKSTEVFYERKKRLAGQSHYPLKKMVSLAWDGITSLSIQPITIIMGIGVIMCLVGIISILWTIVMFFLKQTVAGWASIVCIVWFIGGMQILSLGIIGQYIGKIYMESKCRPRYIISERTWENGEK